MKERPYWQRFLVAIFPMIKRVINVIIIFVIRLFKSTIKTIFGQI